MPREGINAEVVAGCHTQLNYPSDRSLLDDRTVHAMNLPEPNPIAVIHSLGGCGSTLLARCVGCLRNVLVLSECNPASAGLFDHSLNPYLQIKRWHSQFFPAIGHSLQPEDLRDDAVFLKFIAAVKELTDQRGTHLVIRDYNYVDYCGVPFESPATLVSSLSRCLGSALPYQAAVLVRHPLHQYNSLRSHDMLKHTLSPEIYLRGYRMFLNELGANHVLKYEGIVADPLLSIRSLCEQLALPFSGSFIDEFTDNRRVTGNFVRIDESMISFSNRDVSEDEWTRALVRSPEYESLVDLLGYNSAAMPSNRVRENSVSK